MKCPTLLKESFSMSAITKFLIDKNLIASRKQKSILKMTIPELATACGSKKNRIQEGAAFSQNEIHELYKHIEEHLNGEEKTEFFKAVLDSLKMPLNYTSSYIPGFDVAYKRKNFFSTVIKFDEKTVQELEDHASGKRISYEHPNSYVKDILLGKKAHSDDLPKLPPGRG